MKDPVTVETFKRIDEMRTKVNREIMRENLSDEQVAQALLAGEGVSYWDFDDFRDQSLSSFPDIELAEFAWRRWSEGGEVLVNQYIEVIGMITEDLLSIK